jgi:signal transduction histidine kinase/DNA-binding NarL/FixJ family response regulator
MAAVAFAGLATASIWTASNASTEATRIANDRFKFKVSQAQFAIHQRLAAYQEVLRGGVGLFAATDNQVTRAAWHTYVNTLAIDKNYPGIQGVGFAKHILAQQRNVHVLAVRSEGFPDYHIKPAGDRDELTTIIFLEPFDWRNRRAFGFDMFTEPVRRAAMILARDTGAPSISGKVTLVQETDQGVQNGFLMYLPVYQTAVPPATVEERRAGLVGYVYAPFRMRDLMRGILESDQFSGVRLEIYDEASLLEENELYDSAGPSQPVMASAFTAIEPLAIDARTWTIRFTSLPAFDATIDVQKPRLILSAGLLVSLLFSVAVWCLWINRAKARELADANARLSQAKDAAEAANRAKSLFLANMSHELRTPLNAVLGYAQLLKRDGGLNKWQASAIDTVRRSGEHLLTLISDVLDVSKIEAGKLDIVSGPVELPTFLNGVADIIRVRADEKNIGFVFEPSSHMPHWVHADEKRLRQVLLNLLGNAIKFTDRGQVTFRARPIASSRDEVQLRFEVQDTGVGIAGDKQGAIFRPFEQVCDPRRRSGGTGLGLSITRELLRLMGCDVEFESTPGVGSRFWFEVSLPTLEVNLSVADAKELIIAYRGSQRSILIVDDVVENREVLASMLGGVGFEVREAANGLDALEQACLTRPDLILMDVMMPVMDGLEAMRAMRQLDDLKTIPIIAVSASAGIDDRAKSLVAGANAFLSKPVNQEHLFLEVGRLLELGWIYQQNVAVDGDAGGMIVAPPDVELLRVYEATKAGNMRRIRELADDIAAGNATVGAFAARLRELADAYDSKALVAFVGSYIDEKRGAAA